MDYAEAKRGLVVLCSALNGATASLRLQGVFHMLRVGSCWECHYEDDTTNNISVIDLRDDVLGQPVTCLCQGARLTWQGILELAKPRFVEGVAVAMYARYAANQVVSLRGKIGGIRDGSIYLVLMQDDQDRERMAASLRRFVAVPELVPELEPNEP